MSDPSRPSDTCVGLGALEDPALRETSAWSKRRGSSSASLVGRTVGSYVVSRVLGEGGVGTVYLGEHPRVGSRVAIKVLHEEFMDSDEMVGRFVQEARAANAIASPHIVRVSDFGKLEDGRDYSVMEYLEGEPLDAALERDGPFPVARVVQVMQQIAEAMAVAHKAGIVHRDLKPENLFLEIKPDGSLFVRILDFGIAKLLDAAEPDAHETAAGSVLGTPIYCAPEQARGQAVGLGADIYALGAVAYELLTTRPVFAGNVVEVLIVKSTRDASPLGLPDVPPELEALILQMLQRDPAARPASMGEVLERLAPLADVDADLLRRSSRASVHPTLVSRTYGATSESAPTDRPVVVPASDGAPPSVPTRSRTARVRRAAFAAAGALSAVIALLVARAPSPAKPAAPLAAAATEAPSPNRIELPLTIVTAADARPALSVTSAPSAAPRPVDASMPAPPPPASAKPKAARVPLAKPPAPASTRKGTLVDPFE